MTQQIKFLNYFGLEKVPCVFAAMIVSTIPVSILGSKFAMGHDPFWYAQIRVPVP